MLLLGLAVVLIFFTGLWALSLRLENSSVADAGWGPGILLIGVTYYFTSDGHPPRAHLTLILLALWGLRLGLHLGIRNRLEGEDYRYVKMRDQYEDSWWWRSYFQVFLLHAVIAWVVALPIYFAIVSVGPPSLTLRDDLGVLVFTVGLIFESVADEHLRRFRGDLANKGRVLESGLWRYTRHPNYFGEALVWWGFGLIALATGGLPGILGPVVLTYLLVYVSGVPMIESSLITKHGYIHYVGRTPAFVPLPPQVRVKLMQAVRSRMPGSPPPKPQTKRRY